MRRTNVRTVRAEISKLLEAGETVSIGNAYQIRGFLVGLPPHNNWNRKAEKKALRQAKKQILAAIAEELAG